MRELYDKLFRELDELKMKKEWSAYDLENLEKITGSLAHLDQMGGGEHGHSRNPGDWEAHGSYGGGASYNRGGNSYGGYNGGNSGKRHYVRGHYSRDSGYSMDDGREMLIGRMEELMEEADGRDRETIRRCLDMLQRE